MSTKKASKPDLPTTKMKAVRLSRSKAAIVERAAAKIAKARETGDWSRVSNADIGATLPPPHLTVTDFTLPHDVANRVTEETPEVFQQSEAKMAIAALDVPADAGVVTSLGDADLNDPFAEEAAIARIAQRDASKGGTVADENYETMLAQHDRVLQLEGELAGALKRNTGLEIANNNCRAKTKADAETLERLEGEIADMKTVYAASLGNLQLALSKAQGDLHGNSGLLEHAKITIGNLQAELDRLRDETQRSSRSISTTRSWGCAGTTNG